jgi:RNA polymerase sigma factor (sigma-70 family)
VPAATLELDINEVPEEIVEREIDAERLQAAIDSLEDDFKTTLLLFYFEHRSYREIAETLGVPIGTVMSRLARAKARLRGQMCEAERHKPHAGPEPTKRPAYTATGRPRGQ